MIVHADYAIRIRHAFDRAKGRMVDYGHEDAVGILEILEASMLEINADATRQTTPRIDLPSIENKV